MESLSGTITNLRLNGNIPSRVSDLQLFRFSIQHLSIRAEDRLSLLTGLNSEME